jgi:hypothetical protein
MVLKGRGCMTRNQLGSGWQGGRPGGFYLVTESVALAAFSCSDQGRYWAVAV